MRRLVTILLLVLMPLQITWAAACSYCSHHEQGKATRYFGQDVDGHADNSDQPGSQNGAEQPHCCHHHGGALGTVTSVSLPTYTAHGTLAGADNSRLPTALPTRIERPKWSCLV